MTEELTEEEKDLLKEISWYSEVEGRLSPSPFLFK